MLRHASPYARYLTRYVMNNNVNKTTIELNRDILFLYPRFLFINRFYSSDIMREIIVYMDYSLSLSLSLVNIDIKE